MMREILKNKKILIPVICISILLGVSVSSQAAYSVGFSSPSIEVISPGSSGQSFDGTLSVEGKSSLDQVWLCVRGPGGELATYPSEVVDGEFAVKLYLRFGKGTYTIRVGDSPTKFDGKIRFEVKNSATDDTRYLAPSAYVDSDNEKIVELAQSIIEPSMDDMDKAMAIHDWVANNISYDYKAYLAGISQVNKASTILEEGQGICRDYAYLVAALARSLDIPARVVYGSVVDSNNGWEPQLHAWNELQINGRWVIVDATWDAGYIKNGKFVNSPSKKYFDPNNEDFAATHRDAKITLH